MSTFSQIFEKHKYDLVGASYKSRAWYEKQAAAIKAERFSTASLLASDAFRNRNRIIPGELYIFAYIAKHRETLPYWDMYPLVFPFRRMKNGFLGLNMHYLPYHYRIRLFDQLMEFRSNKLMNENTKLRFSWQMIEGASKFKGVDACVKHYLAPQIMSPLKKIDANDWSTAMLLPVEKFVGASKRKVWSESIKK